MKTTKNRWNLWRAVLVGLCLFCATARATKCPPCPPCYSATGSYPDCGCSWNCGDGSCCNGTCATECYKLEVVPAGGWGCTDCGEIGSLCVGEGVLISSHWVWTTVGPGEYGWTNNPTKLDPIRSEIPCVEDWDTGQVLKCGAESVACYYVCKAGWVPCLACLVLEGFDCAEGGLMCSLVEDCVISDDPDDIHWEDVEVADLSGDLGCGCSR